MAEETSRTIDHLTRIPRRYRWALWLDTRPVVGWILGSIGAIWLPAVVAVGISYVLDHQLILAHPWLLIGGLASVQVAAALAAHGAKRCEAYEADLGRLLGLHEFLDWMHGDLFSCNTNTRITIMIRAWKTQPRRWKFWMKPESHRVLRVLLRPSAFPSRSKTELAIAGNEGRIEGVAGACYCAGEEQRVAVSVDPRESEEALAIFAQETKMPLEKVRSLKRRAQFYLALPIEDPQGPRLGVLVIDNLEHTRIVASTTQAAIKRVEERVALLVPWVGLQLKAIPDRILKRA